jgi:molecular chaperone HscB
MKLDSDDFELFDLPRRHALDRGVLDARWRALQAEAHPDRFACEGAAARRVAMQWSVRINEAYQRLKDPLARAGYLCELQGVPVQAETNTAMPASFLMRQMAWREALDEAEGPDAVEALADEVRAARDTGLAALGTLIDDAQDYEAAAAQVRALMFVERFAESIDQRLEALGQ